MAIERYRRLLLRLTIALVVIVVVVPLAIFGAGWGCRDGDESCIFGVGVLSVGYLFAAILALIAVVAFLMVISARRCADTGLNGLLAIGPVLLLADLPFKAFTTWRLQAVPAFDPTSMIAPLLLSVTAVTVFLIMLATTRSEGLRDARSSAPAAYWAVAASGTALTAGALLDVLTHLVALDMRLLPAYSMLLYPLAHLGSLGGYSWFTAAKIVFIIGVVVLMATRRGGEGGSRTARPAGPIGRRQVFGKR